MNKVIVSIVDLSMCHLLQLGGATDESSSSLSSVKESTEMDRCNPSQICHSYIVHSSQQGPVVLRACSLEGGEQGLLHCIPQRLLLLDHDVLELHAAVLPEIPQDQGLPLDRLIVTDHGLPLDRLLDRLIVAELRVL